ncbi:MAG: response regulator [Clostridiaceae bacterium]|nr:response regulator [Clostridiaceae bacterium]
MEKKRILLVDDAAFMRLALRNLLIKNGFEIVEEAKDGREAIEKHSLTRPDLTIMDITMPDMDGLEALREIRKIDPEAKVIVCSAVGQKKLVLEAVRAGAATFVLKPFSAGLLLRTIDKVLTLE